MHISRNEEEEDNSIHKDSDDIHGFDPCAIPFYKTGWKKQQLKGPWDQEVVQAKTDALTTTRLAE